MTQQKPPIQTESHKCCTEYERTIEIYRKKRFYRLFIVLIILKFIRVKLFARWQLQLDAQQSARNIMRSGGKDAAHFNHWRTSIQNGKCFEFDDDNNNNNDNLPAIFPHPIYIRREKLCISKFLGK